MINLRYTRPDNPYFSPEAGEMATADVFFLVLANLNGLGFGVYGVDMGSAPGWTRALPSGCGFRPDPATMPAIADLQQKGKLRAAIEEEKSGEKLTFDQYQCWSASARAPRRPHHRPAC